MTYKADDISDTNLLNLIIAADEEVVARGVDPKGRIFPVISRVMGLLGFTSFVTAGPGTLPIVERIHALHNTLYRPSDLAIGGMHGGIFMFRGVFARIEMPVAYGRTAFKFFEYTDLSTFQIAWLQSRPTDARAFIDQCIDIFDLGGLGQFAGFKQPTDEARGMFKSAAFQLQAAAAALSVAFDFRGAVQSALIGTELALKAGLAAAGDDEPARRKHGHDSLSAARSLALRYPAFDLPRIQRVIERLPLYVANRYSAEQPKRGETGHIVMGAQFIAGEVARQVGDYSFRNAMVPPLDRTYP